MQGDIIIEEFSAAAYGRMEMPIISVTYDTKDYPGQYAARLFDTEKPTQYVIVKGTLEDIRELIPGYFRNIGRTPEDDPVIVEVWI